MGLYDKFESLGVVLLPMVKGVDKENTKRISVGGVLIYTNVPFSHLKMMDKINEEDVASLRKEYHGAENKEEWLEEFLDDLRQIGNIELGTKKGRNIRECTERMSWLDRVGGFYEVKNSLGTPLQQRFAQLGFKLNKDGDGRNIVLNGVKISRASDYILNSILEINDRDFAALATESKDVVASGNVDVTRKWLEDLFIVLNKVSNHKANIKQSNNSQARRIIKSLSAEGGFEEFRRGALDSVVVTAAAYTSTAGALKKRPRDESGSYSEDAAPSGLVLGGDGGTAADFEDDLSRYSPLLSELLESLGSGGAGDAPTTSPKSRSVKGGVDLSRLATSATSAKSC